VNISKKSVGVVDGEADVVDVALAQILGRRQRRVGVAQRLRQLLECLVTDGGDDLVLAAKVSVKARRAVVDAVGDGAHRQTRHTFAADYFARGDENGLLCAL
jgi:hypothetical protein